MWLRAAEERVWVSQREEGLQGNVGRVCVCAMGEVCDGGRAVCV